MVEKRRAASLAVGSLAACALIALVDPHDGGYPTCPTRALLGIDCPACGTLRGLHSLLHGRVVEALDHNLLLVMAAPVALVTWLGWVRTALGRSPSRAIPNRVPSWAVGAVIGVAAVYAIARNLPVEGLSWLSSGATVT